MLNVSRPYLMGLLEAGEIEYSKVGRHRRVPFTALVEDKQHADQRARAAADELGDLGQELGSHNREKECEKLSGSIGVPTSLAKMSP